MLRGEAQIITYDTLYVQRFMTQTGQVCVGFGEVMGLIFNVELSGSKGIFILRGECGGRGRWIISNVGEWERLERSIC